MDVGVCERCLQHLVTSFSNSGDWIHGSVTDTERVTGPTAPLLLLATFPKTLRNCQWVDFLDHFGAEASLIHDSSVKDCGAHVIGNFGSGYKNGCCGRGLIVSSLSPTKLMGLSRRRFKGPWSTYPRLRWQTCNALLKHVAIH